MITVSGRDQSNWQEYDYDIVTPSVDELLWAILTVQETSMLTLLQVCPRNSWASISEDLPVKSA